MSSDCLAVRARNPEVAPALKGNQAQECPRTDKRVGCGPQGGPSAPPWRARLSAGSHCGIPKGGEAPCPRPLLIKPGRPMGVVEARLAPVW